MFPSGVLICAFLSSIVHGDTIRRWSGSSHPTGLVGHGVAESCNSWLNYVSPGERCDILLGQLEISLEDFLGLNLVLGTDCNRLEIGHSYSVGVRASTAVPSSMSQSPRTPTPTPTLKEKPKPVQSGVTPACTRFHKVKEGENCYTISQGNGIPLEDLYAWNPSVGVGCENLWLGYHICVAVGPSTTTITKTLPSTTMITTTRAPAPTVEIPPPKQTGITNRCTHYYRAEKGDTCHSIANSRFKTFTPEQFIEWNPSVGKECTRIYVGYHYCVGVLEKRAPLPTSLPETPKPQPTKPAPAPVHPGTVASCKKYHVVDKWDTCLSIGETYGVSDADFLRWNPEVGYGCENLWAGYCVCVEA